MARCKKKRLLIVIVVAFILFLFWYLQFDYKHLLDQKALLARSGLVFDSNGANSSLIRVGDEFTREEYKRLRPISKFLHYMAAFMTDVEILSHGTNFYNTVSQPFRKESGVYYFNYGVFKWMTNQWTPADLELQFKIRCQINEAWGMKRETPLLTAVYITCPDLNAQIQLSIFYTRREFFWIGSDNRTYKKHFFGDTPRATQLFQKTIITDIHSNVLWAPSNVRRFLYDYKYSKFLECDYKQAAFNRQQYSYVQNTRKNSLSFPSLKHISNVLETFQKMYWLHSGTLLGWYRDCGILPHIDDVDVGIMATDYERKIKNAFMGNKNVSIRYIFGVPNDIYEFRMTNRHFLFDLFLFYKPNSTHMYSGYHGTTRKVSRKYYSWFKAFDTVCSGELFGHKFFVPCDPVQVLSDNYGPPEKWKTPSTRFKWSSINLNYWVKWTDEEWLKVRRVYDTFGNLNVKETLARLNVDNRPKVTNITDEYDL